MRLSFVKEDDNKIKGFINSYNISLTSLTNIEGEEWLMVLIPLQIREGLDNYFVAFDDTFKFQLIGQVLFAEAILKKYDQWYDFKKLVGLLERTTQSLKDK